MYKRVEIAATFIELQIPSEEPIRHTLATSNQIDEVIEFGVPNHTERRLEGERFKQRL